MKRVAGEKAAIDVLESCFSFSDRHEDASGVADADARAERVMRAWLRKQQHQYVHERVPENRSP